MIRTGQKVLTALVAGGVLVGGAGLAYADVVHNTLDNSIDNAKEAISFTAGETTKTVFIRINASQDTGEATAMCNVSTLNPLKVAVTSDKPAAASVTSQIEFTACGVDVPVTVTKGAPNGDVNIDFAKASGTNNGGTFDFMGARFQVVTGSAPADTTAPTSSAAATVPAGAGTAPYASGTWTNQTVTVALSGQDAGSGLKEIRYTTDGSAPSASSSLYTAPLSFPSDTERTIRYVAVDNAGNVQASANSFVVRVDKTAPSVTPADVTDTAWRNTDRTATFTATDGGSGLSPAQGLTAAGGFTLTASDESASPSLPTTDSKTVSDVAGNTTTRTLSARIDRTAPTVSYTDASGTSGSNGWYTSPVTATFTGTDTLSGPASARKDVTSTTDGAAVLLNSPAFEDAAGNVRPAGAASESFKIDTAAPVLSDDQTVSTWSNAASVESDLFTASDATSGIAEGDKSFRLSVSAESTRSAADAVVPTVATRDVTDVAGHTSTARFSALIDRTKPTVALAGGPAAGTHWSTQVAAAPTCDGSDALSGLAAGSCVVTGYSTTAGTHTVTATATDRAGNTASDSRTYTVRDLTSTGFYQPVDMGGVYNTVKGGSTVPLKFNLLVDGAQQTATSLITGFTTAKVGCQSGTAEDAVEMTTTGATALRYDSTAGQFVQNWKTPTGAGTCYRATATLADGDTITALFKLK